MKKMLLQVLALFIVLVIAFPLSVSSGAVAGAISQELIERFNNNNGWGYFFSPLARSGNIQTAVMSSGEKAVAVLNVEENDLLYLIVHNKDYSERSQDFLLESMDAYLMSNGQVVSDELQEFIHIVSAVLLAFDAQLTAAELPDIITTMLVEAQEYGYRYVLAQRLDTNKTKVDLHGSSCYLLSTIMYSMVVFDPEPTLKNSDKAKPALDGEAKVDGQHETMPSETVIRAFGNMYAIGEAIEFTIFGAGQSFALYPPNTSGVHTYMPGETGKTFLFLEGEITNLSGDTIWTQDIIVKGKFQDKYNYVGTCFSVEENRISSYTSIVPLETRKVYFALSVPDRVAQSSEQFDITLSADKHSQSTFTFSYRTLWQIAVPTPAAMPTPTATPVPVYPFDLDTLMGDKKAISLFEEGIRSQKSVFAKSPYVYITGLHEKAPGKPGPVFVMRVYAVGKNYDIQEVNIQCGTYTYRIKQFRNMEAKKIGSVHVSYVDIPLGNEGFGLLKIIDTYPQIQATVLGKGKKDKLTSVIITNLSSTKEASIAFIQALGLKIMCDNRDAWILCMQGNEDYFVDSSLDKRYPIITEK